MTSHQQLQVSPTPHVVAKLSTSRMMVDVLIALIPVTVTAAIIFGWHSLQIPLICVATCVLTEMIFNFCRKKPNSLGDFSAVLTGLILAFSVPPSLPSCLTPFLSSRQRSRLTVSHHHDHDLFVTDTNSKSDLNAKTADRPTSHRASDKRHQQRCWRLASRDCHPRYSQCR